MIRAKAGDHHALRFLYTTYYPTVLRYADSLVRDTDAAEDVAQTTFLKLLTKIHLYETRQVPFEAWLLRVARNVAFDELRRRRSRPASELLEHDQPTVDAVAERFGTVNTALSKLPDQEREVLVLRYVVGLSFDEIAERLDSTGPAVRALHQRGRSGLQVALRRGGASRLSGAVAWSRCTEGEERRRMPRPSPTISRPAVEAMT